MQNQTTLICVNQEECFEMVIYRLQTVTTVCLNVGLGSGHADRLYNFCQHRQIFFCVIKLRLSVFEVDTDLAKTKEYCVN